MSNAKRTLGVAGNPIAHSLSPDIHHGFARSLGHDVDYQRLCFPLDGFNAGAKEFFATGGLGLNVTVPLKTRLMNTRGR
jgi:shikimate dehydrogenase